MSAELVRLLRNRTGAGVLACQKAIRDCDGDIDKAEDMLRVKGIISSDKKASRKTSEGIVYSYIHHDKRIGVLLELNCETDFVAMNEEFIGLAHELAIHIVGSRPIYVSKESIPPIDEVQERELNRRKTLEEGKPAHIADKIIDGRMEKFYNSTCLLNQPYIKDDTLTVKDFIKTYISKIGENIRVKRFSLFLVGED